MVTIFQAPATCVNVSISRLRKVTGLPLATVSMVLSLPTMATSPIGIEPNEIGVIRAVARKAMS
jgi:hypothetical protein